LSIKSIYGYVPRYNNVKVKALDINGEKIRINATGFLARVIQHEIDHTNGNLFVDHIKQDPGAFFKLTDNGTLESLDYNEKIKNSTTLWQEN
ncbi:peptide deformylase, partial [Candidatus Saccharibacteria bacterium]|nr:peptide deformylase [Candidatus Saccharibacteria bacterium]